MATTGQGSAFWGASNQTAGQAIPCLQWNTKASSHVHKIPTATLFCNTLQHARFDGDECLASRPTPNKKDHPLLSVRHRSFRIFAPISSLRHSQFIVHWIRRTSNNIWKMYKLKTQRHMRLLGNTKLFLMPDMFRSCPSLSTSRTHFNEKYQKFYSACGDTFQLRDIKVLMIWQKQLTSSSFFSVQILCFNKIMLHNMLKLFLKHIAAWSIVCDESTFMCIMKAENSFSPDIMCYTHNTGIVSKHPSAIFQSKYTHN